MFEAEFEASDILGVQDWVDEPEKAPKYDAVTCMFAIHYFFVTPQALKQFLRNVSLNLKIGETFCLRSQQVLKLISGRECCLSSEGSLGAKGESIVQFQLLRYVAHDLLDKGRPAEHSMIHSVYDT